MRRIISLCLLAAMATSLCACIVEEPGPGPAHDRWCYDHPYRCRR